MRKLDRSAVAAPLCLSCYRHGRQKWDAVTAEHRKEIRKSLERMQGRRCAYCEGPLDELGEHIEHFRTRSSRPELTFNWQNLFWSCDQDDSCGRFKDNHAGPFDPAHLLDPCIDDPDRFFRFRSNGVIDVRPELASHEKKRANETLRVFSLDREHGRLRRMRELALRAYRALEPNIIEALEEFPPEDRQDFIAAELERTSQDPFSAVIRHFFEGAA